MPLYLATRRRDYSALGESSLCSVGCERCGGVNGKGGGRNGS